MTPDLVRVEIPVRWDGAPPASHPGRALNAWFYGRIAERSEELAHDLHAQNGAKPFTVALLNLHNEPDPMRLVVTGCGPLAPFVEILADGTDRVLLDGRWLEPTADPRIQSDTFGEMASHWLMDSSSPRPVRLEFLTPTAFHSRGRTLPLPVPEMLFGGLLQRWQAWSTVDLGAGAAQVVVERSALRRHRLWSVMIQMEGKITGFLGWAEFTLVRSERAYAGLLALLASFAEYVGVGQKTGMGLGCVRTNCQRTAPHFSRR